MRLKYDRLSGWTLGARAGMRGLGFEEASVAHHEATRATFLTTEKTAEEASLQSLVGSGYGVRTARDRKWRSSVAPA